MSQIEVPDWVVEAACAKLAVGMEFEGKWPEDYQDEAGDELREAMRAAITAALGAWVVPVGYQETITVQDDGVFADIEWKLWHWIPGKPIPESTADTFREPIYVLRQEKPE